MITFKEGDSTGFILQFGFTTNISYSLKSEIRDGAKNLIDTAIIKTLNQPHRYFLSPSKSLKTGRYALDIAVCVNSSVSHSETYYFRVVDSITGVTGKVLDASIVNIDIPENENDIVIKPIGELLGINANSDVINITPIVFANSEGGSNSWATTQW